MLNERELELTIEKEAEKHSGKINPLFATHPPT
jgi:hypothetical protein